MADGEDVAVTSDSPGTTDSAAADAPSASSTGESMGEFALSDSVMLNDDLDEVIVPETPAKAGEVPAEAGAKPASEGAARPAQAPAASEAKAPAPKAPAAPAAASQPGEPAIGRPQAAPGTAPDLSSLGPKDLATELGRNRDAMITALAEQRFALSKEEKDALEIDAVAAIPKLLARVYFDAVTASMNNLATHVPRLVESVSATMVQTSNAENAFYSKFPGIDRNNAEHSRAVNMAANIFRQNNPTATQEQAIDAVGKMTTALLGIQVPVAPAQTNGARNGAPRPFAPASGTARTIAAQPVNKPAANPWEGLGANFDEG